MILGHGDQKVGVICTVTEIQGEVQLYHGTVGISDSNRLLNQLNLKWFKVA